MKNSKKNLIIILLVSIYLIFVKITSIRICLIYNLFHIPCPACGLTRSYFSLFTGDIIQSLNYNFLAIPLAIFFILYCIFTLSDDINKTNKVEEFLKKHEKIIIFITVILAVLSWILNLNKSYLY